MAKAKKTAATPKKKPAAQKPAAAPAGPGVPLVDTSLAAQLAARALANRAKLGQQSAAAEPAEEDSPSFKQLKESMKKPQSQLLGDALHKITPASQRPGNLPTGQDRPAGHAQTHSLNRVGVPRRTPG